MNKEERKVPELRFKGFHDDWEQRKLKVVTDKIGSGKTPRGGNAVYQTSGIPFLRSQNIKDNSVSFNEIVYIDENTNNEMINSLVLSNDVLLNITGASIGRSAVYKNFEPANVNQHVCIIRPNQTVNSNFIQLNLSSVNGQKQIDNNQAGGGREGLNFKQIGKMSFYYPILNEQIKVGEFFSYLDKTITLHQRKYVALTKFKKAYLEKIFNQKLIFKEGNNEWKEQKFNDFMYKPNKLLKAKNIDKNQLLTVKLFGKGVTIANQNRALKLGATTYYERFAGDFIYGKQNFFNGAFGFIDNNLDGYYSSGDVPALKFNSKIVDRIFFLNYISRKNFYKRAEAYSSGTGSKRIHEETLLDFKVKIPIIEEQQKMGILFNEIDELINFQSEKLKQLNNIKTTYLNKMFI